MDIYHNSFYSMGSRLNAVFPYYNHEICEHVFQIIQREVLRIESKLSYFSPASEVNKINNTAYKNAVNLDDELFGVLDVCLKYSELTSGAFDITLRPVIENIEGAGESVGMQAHSYIDKIELDRDNKSVSFGNEKLKIDFGGFGKGYALEKVKSILDESPIGNAFISFGESSILAKGKHPKGDYWQVGINNLIDTGSPVYTFRITDSSISTSGNYYVDDSGQMCKKVNVISPFTCKPVEEIEVVTIKSDSPVEAEILSTAFLVMDDKQIYKSLEKFNKVEAIKINYRENEPVIKIYNGN